ncbi:cob(I)yrinic acid a,c-diamide adenosyltransferase [Urechidicola sp. KH5]
MKIYTKTGDKGETSLFGGTRVSKDHIRIEAYGTIDELNSYLGLLRDHISCKNLFELIVNIQDNLFVLGAELATPKEKEILKNGKDRLNINRISNIHIQQLEQQIDLLDSSLPPMTHFVLPGGHPMVSYCHIARCVCRRAERNTVKLNNIIEINHSIIQYLNRLSDYLFVLARKLTYDNKIEEIKWIPKQKE